jgi:hypothetical protein
MAEKLLVLDALGGCTLAPEPKAGAFERFSHVGDYLTLSKASDLTDFLKGNPIGPGSPVDPIWTALGWFRFFHPGNRIAGLFGLQLMKT